MRKQQQEAGIVSIIVATLLIIIVSLIVVAFAQVSRREQRESLDAQLSTQAYYAAETGVNAATAVVQSMVASNPSGITQPDCKAANGPFSTINYDLNPATPNAIVITCLTVDASPQELTYQLNTDAATVVPVFPANGATISSLTFSWPKTTGFANDKTACRSVKPGGGAWTLPTENTWKTTWGCPFMAIRADFVPGGNLNRDFLLANDKVSFMLPVNSGSNLGAGILNDVTPALCNATTCSVTYSNLNQGSMYLRLVSLYEGGENVTITGRDASNSPIDFTNAQAKIDSTGRAQDVLRRIVVSAPLQSGNGTTPIQALVSGDSVCKRFGVFTNYYQNFAPASSGCE